MFPSHNLEKKYKSKKNMFFKKELTRLLNIKSIRELKICEMARKHVGGVEEAK